MSTSGSRNASELWRCTPVPKYERITRSKDCCDRSPELQTGPELKDLAEALLRDDFFGARGISGPGADSSQYYLNPLCPLIVLGLGFLLIFHVNWLNAGRHRRDLTIWGGLLSWLKK